MVDRRHDLARSVAVLAEIAYQIFWRQSQFGGKRQQIAQECLGTLGIDRNRVIYAEVLITMPDKNIMTTIEHNTGEPLFAVAVQPLKLVHILRHLSDGVLVVV